MQRILDNASAKEKTEVEDEEVGTVMRGRCPQGPLMKTKVLESTRGTPAWAGPGAWWHSGGGFTCSVTLNCSPLCRTALGWGSLEGSEHFRLLAEAELGHLSWV